MTTNGWIRRSVWGLVSASALASGCAAGNSFSLSNLGWDRTPTASNPESREIVEESWTNWFWPQPAVKDPGRLHSAYAKWQEELGNFGVARESYEAVLRDDPKAVDAILGLARLDQLAGRPSEAERAFRKAIQLRPDDPAIYDAFGQFYASQQRWTESIDALNMAMAQAPEDPTYRYHLAVALASAGDVASAMPHFVKTVGEAEAHYNIGYILYEHAEFDEAEYQFVQAVQKRPDLAEAQRMLDEVRYEQQRALDVEYAAEQGIVGLHGEPPSVPPRRPQPPPQGWPRSAPPEPPTTLDPQRSYMAGYGQPNQNHFVPANYPVLPELAVPVFTEDPGDTMRR